MRLNVVDRDILRRLHLKNVRAHTITEAHLSRLIGLVESGHATAYEVDGGIWFGITEEGRKEL